MSFQMPSTPVVNYGAPFGEAMNQVYQRALLDQQAKQLQIQNQFLPQMSQADLDYKNMQTQLMPDNTKAALLNAQGRYNANNPQMQLTKMLQLLPQNARDQFIINHPELRQYLDASSQVVSMGGIPGQQIQGSQPVSPNLKINYSNGPITDISQMPQLPMANKTKAINNVANAGLQNQLTINPDNLVQALKDHQALTTGRSFITLPQDQKNAMVAQASGMGIDPLVASKMFMNGSTLQDMAKQQGFNPSNMPDPIYPTTKTSLDTIQRRQQAIAEINTLNPILTEAIAPFARRFNGYSPAQIAGAISGEDPEKQARYLGASTLMPDLQALRVKAMGGQVSAQAINEISEASMARLKAFSGLVSPEVYKQSQQYVDQWLQLGADRANKVGLRTYGNNQSSQTSANNANQKIRVYNPKTGRIE